MQMRRIIINQCYCDSFDISREAKDMMRNRFGIIFDPNYTPRDDPALIAVVETLGEGAAIFHEDQTCGRVYLSRPRIAYVPVDATFDIISNYGYESINLHDSGSKRKRPNADYHEQATKKMNCRSMEN